MTKYCDFCGEREIDCDCGGFIEECVECGRNVDDCICDSEEDDDKERLICPVCKEIYQYCTCFDEEDEEEFDDED